MMFSSLMLTFISLFYIFVEGTAGLNVFHLDLIWYYYGVILTVSLLILGVFDEDLTKKQINRFPEIYKESADLYVLSLKKLLYITFKSLAASFVIFIFIIQIEIANENGFTHNRDLLEAGMYISMFGSFIIYFIIETLSYNRYTVSAYLLSIALLIIFYFGLSNTHSSEMFGLIDMLNMSPIYVINIIMVSLVCFLLFYSTKCLQILFYPSAVDYLRSGFKGNFNFEFNPRLKQFNGNLDRIFKYSKGSDKNKNNDAFTLNT